MKKLLTFILLLSFISCSNLLKLNKYSAQEQEKIIKENFNELSNDFYFLLEDEISEGKRKKLEEKFIYLKKEIISINNTGSTEHRKFLNGYLNLINIKIQYLKDLK